MDIKEKEKMELEVRKLGQRKLELTAEIPKLTLKSNKLKDEVKGLQDKYNKSSKDFLGMEKKKNILSSDTVKKENTELAKEDSKKKKLAELDVELSKLEDQSKGVEKERTELKKSVYYYNAKTNELSAVIEGYKGRLRGIENAENLASDTLKANAKKSMDLEKKLTEMDNLALSQERKYDDIRFKDHIIDGKNAKLENREEEIIKKEQNLAKTIKKTEDRVDDLDRQELELSEKLKKAEALRCSFEAQKLALDDERAEINIERLKVKRLINKKNLKKELKDLEESVNGKGGL